MAEAAIPRVSPIRAKLGRDAWDGGFRHGSSPYRWVALPEFRFTGTMRAPSPQKRRFLR